MLNFKEQLIEDLDRAFFNLDEFAEVHKISGVRGAKVSPAVECTVVVDKELYYERKAKDGVENITLDGLVLYIKESEWVEGFGNAPSVYSELFFDGKRYVVEAVSEVMGALEITLTANRG